MITLNSARIETICQATERYTKKLSRSGKSSDIRIVQRMNDLATWLKASREAQPFLALNNILGLYKIRKIEINATHCDKIKGVMKELAAHTRVLQQVKVDMEDANVAIITEMMANLEQFEAIDRFELVNQPDHKGRQREKPSCDFLSKLSIRVVSLSFSHVPFDVAKIIRTSQSVEEIHLLQSTNVYDLLSPAEIFDALRQNPRIKV